MERQYFATSTIQVNLIIRLKGTLPTMAENSFDIASKVDLAEATNAIQQAMKEIVTRFDLKDSKSEIKLEKDVIQLQSVVPRVPSLQQSYLYSFSSHILNL